MLDIQIPLYTFIHLQSEEVDKEKSEYNILTKIKKKNTLSLISKLVLLIIVLCNFFASGIFIFIYDQIWKLNSMVHWW